ncbi:UNVERIFIED_CONTAM: hypothetical protein PYX00_000393 [Menopon gallinae]|uniref:protein acetyllysine N-acetyltransferase n=1 Tax=Menopon gallinae TaxID=328185 RepID=A0AAW2I9U2_9NEOP
MSEVNNGSCTERHLSRLRSKRANIVSLSAQKERNLSIKKISRILRKDEAKRTKEENDLLSNYSEIVKEAAIRLQKREKLKERLKEVEDVESVIDEKCKQLAEALSKAEYLVVYTGAGISTSARIPDYRGASGIWTLLQQGKDIGSHDLTQAEPTYTHMALSQLYLHGKLKHVVSQNCDGLHLRSGLPKRALSEVHGNMYIEVCRSCRPIVEYLRLFDVTEYTARYSHKTMRRCYKCNNPLVDSIVHFGERGNLPWPLNWKGACKAAEKADVILCMGSSLKVLKRYPWLWSMDKPPVRRPHLYIVNLQWTPKDYQAVIKINGKCDNVMKKVMKYMSISVPRYSKKLDPIFMHATVLCKEEEHTTNRPLLTLNLTESDDGEAVVKTEPDLPCVEEKKIKTEVDFLEELVTVSGNGIKEELILITVKSSEEIGDCCVSYKRKQVHDENCVNFIDENLDIPVIMHDDLSASEKFLSPVVKAEPDSQKSTSSSNNLNVNITVHCSTSDGTEIKTETNKRTVESADEVSPVKKIKCEEESPTDRTSGKLAKKCEKNNSRSVNKKSSCSFCSEHYLSTTCLFYVKMEPVFKGNDPPCVCCDDSEEDDDEEGEEKESKRKETDSTPDTKINNIQKVVNPGWYGKGCRKRFRRK